MGFLVQKATAVVHLHWCGLIPEPYAVSYLVSYPIMQVFTPKPEPGGLQVVFKTRRASETSDQEQAAGKTPAREET